MPPYDRSQIRRVGQSRTDVIAPIGAHHTVDVTARLHHHQCFDSRPVVPTLQATQIVEDDATPCLDAPMVLVDPFGAGVRYALITGPCSRLEEAFYRRGQAGLVVFDQQRVVGFLLDNLGSDRFLAAHRVDDDDAAL
jgi:hypothetical protein